MEKTQEEMDYARTEAELARAWDRLQGTIFLAAAKYPACVDLDVLEADLAKVREAADARNAAAQRLGASQRTTSDPLGAQ